MSSSWTGVVPSGAAGQIPDRAVGSAGEQPAPVRTKGQCKHTAFRAVSLPCRKLSKGASRFQRNDLPVLPARCQPCTAWMNSQAVAGSIAPDQLRRLRSRVAERPG